jgi:hypothetical protein
MAASVQGQGVAYMDEMSRCHTRLAGICAAVLTALTTLIAPSANATILTATFTGVVFPDQEGDILGLFGPAGANLAGDAVTATYTIDDSKGESTFNPPSSSALFGGPLFGTLSPIATTLTIGGKSLFLAGTGESQVDQSGPPPSGFSGVDYSTEDVIPTSDGSILVAASNAVENVINSYDYHDAPSFATNPNLPDGLLDEIFIVDGVPTTSGTIEWLPDSFTFSVSSDVPEPANWAMLVVGFAATGAFLRRAPKRALLAG